MISALSLMNIWGDEWKSALLESIKELCGATRESIVRKMIEKRFEISGKFSCDF